MLYLPLCLHGELSVIAIGTMHNAYALDLLGGKGCNVLFLVAHEPQSFNTTSISQSDMFPVRFQLPTCLLILNRAVIMLEPGIALLPRLVVLAVVIEAGDSKPCTVSRFNSFTNSDGNRMVMRVSLIFFIVTLYHHNVTISSVVLLRQRAIHP